MSKYENSQRKPNRLIDQTSPYLLQHAHNPVKWYPWGEEALSEARVRDKPILLSIGYSACHWCHVMAHESFEDDDTADVMNQYFVNIKVDREERPDLDKIYQFAHQVLMRRGGGWPLTVILTPDKQIPFFAGTYFPKEPRHNMPTFKHVLNSVSEFYREQRGEVEIQNASFVDLLQKIDRADTNSIEIKLTATLLDQSRQQLQKNYDELFAGFGSAPKFPHPTNIERLCRHWSATQHSDAADKVALDMALTTLKSMALGGIYDQLGGGFYRYSVDAEWMIPHFEKMLYDNGPLLCCYIDAWRISGDKLFQQVALETGDWVLREMQSADGGFYSSLDADSEGKEGRFYAWQVDEVRSLLDEETYNCFAARFGLDKIPNFDQDWHLHVYETIENIASKFSMPHSALTEIINDARQLLFREREDRARPDRDEKILTAWNALMIKGLALTGRFVQRNDFIDAASDAVYFIQEKMFIHNSLRVSYKDGQTKYNAYLDDYAFLLDAILELLQSRWDSRLLQFAQTLADILLNKFQDQQRGGFYFTANDHEQLIQRPKPYADEALPAGNGIAAHALLRLGYLLAESKYIQAAERTIHSAWASMLEAPSSHNALLLAVEELLMPTQIVVIRATAEKLNEWQNVCQKNYAPRRMVLAIENSVTGLPEALDTHKAASNPIVYICNGQHCETAIKDLEQLKVAMNVSKK